MNKTFKLVLLIIGAFLLLSFGVYKLLTLHAAGGYPSSKKYEINYSRDKVILAARRFRSDNPDFFVPKVKINNAGYFDLPDQEPDSSDNWCNVYFYLKKENLIIRASTKPLTKDKTTFAFVSVNKGLSLDNWQNINQDLSSGENTRLIQIFETEIFKPIQGLVGQEVNMPD